MKIFVLILDLISGAWSLIFKLALVIIAIVVVIGFVHSCSANSNLSEQSSCNQFEQADATTQNNVIQDMITAHHSLDSVSLTLSSVTLYCDVHGANSPIDGIYGSGNVSQQPAQALYISAPLMTLVYLGQAI